MSQPALPALLCFLWGYSRQVLRTGKRDWGARAATSTAFCIATFCIAVFSTAFGSFGSSLKDTPAADLGTVALENVKEEGISWDL